jgi:hypothetical protein
MERRRRADVERHQAEERDALARRQADEILQTRLAEAERIRKLNATRDARMEEERKRRP